MEHVTPRLHDQGAYPERPDAVLDSEVLVLEDAPARRLLSTFGQIAGEAIVHKSTLTDQ